MPNAKTLVKSKKSVCVYGPTGTGKTTIFTQIPGRKLAYLFDPSTVDSIAGLDIDYEPFFPDSILGPRRTQKGKVDPGHRTFNEPKAYRAFEDHVEDQIERGFPDHDVIGFHSLTMLQDELLERLLYINGMLGSASPIEFYNLAGVTMMSIFKAVVSVPGKVIFLEAHSDVIHDEKLKRIYKGMDIVKNVRRLVPRLLTDLWISSSDNTVDGQRHYIQTSPSKEFDSAKNSFNLPHMVDVTLDLTSDREGQFIGRLFGG